MENANPKLNERNERWKKRQNSQNGFEDWKERTLYQMLLQNVLHSIELLLNATSV